MAIAVEKLDLNLLKVFDVLMEERSVSRAARRIGVTQSSASNALDRLRNALNDRVLERVGNSMVPTQTATQLWPHVRIALSQIADGLNALDDFNPAILDQTLQIGIDEYSLTLLGPGIEARLTKAAPNLRLAFLPAMPDENQEALFAGDLDLIIGPAWQPIPGLERTALIHETFVALVDEHHPLIAVPGGVSVEDYVRYSHILVSMRGFVGGNVDIGLRRLGMHRRVALTTPFFASAPRFVCGTDRILNMGRRLAEKLASVVGMATFELPIAVPGFDICVFWHPRNNSAKAHEWIRTEIQRATHDTDSAD